MRTPIFKRTLCTKVVRPKSQMLGSSIRNGTYIAFGSTLLSDDDFDEDTDNVDDNDFVIPKEDEEDE